MTVNSVSMDEKHNNNNSCQFSHKKFLWFFVPAVVSDQPNESEIALGLSDDMLMECSTPESNRKISMIFPLVSCCTCVNNPSSS